MCKFMANDINKQIVATLREKIAKAKSIVVTDYIGLKANDINNLRSTMKNAAAEIAVSKNTLMKIALKEENITSAELANDLEGPTAVLFSYKDPVQPIKVLFDFIKKVELPKIKSGFFDGQYTTATQIETISKLPTREVLIAQFVGGLKSPLNGIVGAFSGVQRKFVYAIAAIADKKQK